MFYLYYMINSNHKVKYIIASKIIILTLLYILLNSATMPKI